jgi:hypothetical protein
MIFSLLKLIILIAGVTVVGYFVLQKFGYEINWNYWNDSKLVCQENLNQCRKDLIKSGFEGAKETCDWKCVDPKLIIKKQDKDAIIDTETSANN